jgi:RecA-family ATPase
MIAGKQGLSKSTLTVEIGAIVSRADAWPIDGTRAEGGEVLFLNAEDDPSDTIRPRLRAAGAVLERVHIIEGVRLSSGKRRLVTLADVALLDTYLAKHPGRFALLIVDPVGAFLAGKDSHKDSEVRELLAPLKDVAERHGLAVVLVAHLNKAAGFDAIYRVVGSVAFTAVVRALYILAPDPEDEQRLLLLPEKASNAPANMAGLSYRLQSADLGNGIVAPRIVWETIEMRSADQVLNPPRPDREAPDRDQAEVWLREQLADGPVPVKELRQAAGDELACSWDTVKRAADVLGLVGRGEKKARTWELSSKGAREQKGEVHESKGCTQAPADGKGAASPSRAPSTLAPLHLSELPTGSPDEPDGDVL